MDTWQRRTGYYVLGLIGVMLVYTLLYRWASATFEGDFYTLYVFSPD